MSTNSNETMRRVLGPNLQVGAARAVGILAAFALIGASAAWLIH